MRGNEDKSESLRRENEYSREADNGVVTNLGEGLREGKGRKGGEEEDRQGRGKEGRGWEGGEKGRKGEGKIGRGNKEKCVGTVTSLQVHILFI